VNNCRDAAALSLNSLLNDSSGLNLSLRRTTNAILKWIKPDYAEWYREKLSATRFDSDLRAIAKRVRSVRNKVIAHSEWEPNSETPTVAPLVTDADLERLYTGAVSLFRACSLTAEYVIDIQDYAVTPTRPRAIDRYLALIARESAYLRQPEQRGDWWASTRNHLPPGSLDELNRWRAEFGLPPA
jgi:hypothetical protein